MWDIFASNMEYKVNENTAVAYEIMNHLNKK
jgi:hypothetical protein